jgi:hypothetical protein
LRGALKQRDVAGHPGQTADQLHARRPVADDRDAPPAHVDAVIPARGVKNVAAEVIQARDRRQSRVMQHAGGRDQEVDRRFLPGSGAQHPAAVLETRVRDLGAEPDAFPQPVAVGDVPEIGLDFAAGREQMRPVGIPCKAVLVDARRDVADQTGIRVVPPRAADLVGLLVDGHIANSAAQQGNCDTQPRHAGSDDGHGGITSRHRNSWGFFGY